MRTEDVEEEEGRTHFDGLRLGSIYALIESNN